MIRVLGGPIARRVGLAALALGLVAASGAALAAPHQAAPSAPETFTVHISGETPNGDIQSYNYYPDVLTIDVGDTVTWVEESGPHTVLFLGHGGQVPVPGSPPSQTPAGGPVYNGSTTVNSGTLLPGKTFSLTFTKAGTFEYLCGLHPDMTGVVIVQPAGTPRPLTPVEALLASQVQEQLDLNAGIQAWNDARVTTTPGKNDTTVYHVDADLPSPAVWTGPLADPQTGASRGDLTLRFSAEGVTLDLAAAGLQPNAKFSADFRMGSGALTAPVMGRWPSFATNSKGQGQTTLFLKGDHSTPGNIAFADIMTANGKKVVATGQGDYPQYGSLRFVPGTLTIHAGDTIVWTQRDPHEAHTVTILAPGQTPQQADQNLAKQVGGHVVNGLGFFNSGLIWYGQSYALTFNKPGTYHYRCLLHDDFGMLGTVVVLPG